MQQQLQLLRQYLSRLQQLPLPQHWSVLQQQLPHLSFLQQQQQQLLQNAASQQELRRLQLRLASGLLQLLLVHAGCRVVPHALPGIGVAALAAGGRWLLLAQRM